MRQFIDKKTMRMRNLYLLLVAVVLIGFTSCSKGPKAGGGTGNVTGNLVGIDPPAGSTDGVTFINAGKSAIFNLYAPGKKTVAVIGEFNNWAPTAMTNSKDGTRWWVQIDNLDPTTEYAYQYYIDASLKVADPYTNKVLDPGNDPSIPTSVYPNLKAYPTGSTTGIVSTFWYGAPAYSWQNASFTAPDPQKLVIYELLPRDFVATHSYKTLTDTVSYIANLGCNAIELLPVNEFEGNDSWGYNSNFMFALDKYYGTPNDYKAFIDACHAKGIAVIQDIVLEDQFGSSPLVQMYANSSGAPTAANPWLDQTNMHPDAVGYQMNHQSAATQYFSENVMKYWMQEYHIDGYRFDEAKGYTQVNSPDEGSWANYDASRVALWEKYNTYMKGINPNFYVILEMFSANTEEAVYASKGMMCWANLSTNGEQALMSYNDSGGSWDLGGLFYDSWGFSTSTGNVAYFESHDQERLQFKNGKYGNVSGSYSIKDLATGLKRDEMGAVFMFSAPGPKMVWQFGERGYDVSIDDLGGRLSDKPPHWEYMADPNRHHLYQVYSDMIRYKIKNPVFNTTNFHYALAGTIKTIQLIGTDGTDVEVVGNFGVVSASSSVNFPATGTWTDNLDGSSINVTATPLTLTLAPGEYHVYSNKPLLK